MLGYVARRARAQGRVLVAVVALVTVATSLLGVCALLLGPTQDRAFHGGVLSLAPADVDVTAYVVDLDSADLTSSRDDAEALVREVLGGLDPTVTSSATSRMRQLADGSGLGYLATGDVEDRAEVVDGRWPAGPGEAALPVPAAERLGLAVGDAVTLGTETGLGSDHDPVPVTLVGTFRITDPAAWSGDPLSGAGFDPAYSDGSQTAPTSGPFVVDEPTFLASGSHVSGLRVTGTPSLTKADDASLSRAAGDLDDGSARLSADIGDRARITRLASELPRTLDRLQAQVDSTRSTVLVVLLLVSVLALSALLLAGHLVAAARDEERALLVGIGLSVRQQLTAAALEALLVALVAAVLAVPLAALAHAWLTGVGPLAEAGLSQSAEVTVGLVVTVVVGALLLASALVVQASAREPVARPRTRRRVVADVSLDVLLLAITALAWWQLDSQPATAESTGDLVTTLAPVLCLLAGTAVVVRRVPPLLALLARAGHRARSLVVPLATAQSARRPRAGLGLVLLAAAVAAATFGIALQATWERSQHDQADLRVGTDLAVTLPGAATLRDARAVADAVPGGTVSPVASPGVALGRYVGDADARPVLLALDAGHAGDLLRGRSGAQSWSEIGADLAAGDPVGGVPVPEEVPAELTGTIDAADLRAVVTAVVQDETGLRYDVASAPVRLDGAAHPLRWLSAFGAGRLVSVLLEVSAPPTLPTGAARPVPLTLSLQLPGAEAGSDDAAWQVTPLSRDTPVRSSTIAVTGSGDGVELRTDARVDLTYLAYSHAELLATSFTAPDAVPAALSQATVDATGAKIGGTLSATVGGVSVPLEVTAVVPTVPSEPGQVAVLVDEDTLSRVLLSAGRLDPVVDGYWVDDPPAGAAARLASLGAVSSRAEVVHELARGPLRATTPTALLVLTGAGAVLLLAGAGLLVGTDQRRRAAEVLRLRAMGLTRPAARTLLLTEHSLVLLPLVVLGAAVGGAAAWALGPLLVRSDLGAAPVPAAQVVWPWDSELLLNGGLLVGAALVAAVVATLQVRRADPSLLRTDET
ncbi:permease [Nocardioides anomalus]|uniref:Permease n=1 Tax=Nocardioides anomalus TaxID=2712223 RepID=A0A6G6W8N2_9ACTN|nr:FtsX-like permease family protein [Nocardioides anomalus]QIG41576.1 permease [Nocardioides anomalus]